MRLQAPANLARNMTKKFLLICLNKTQRSFHFFLLFCSFISGNFFVFFMLTQLGRFLGPLSLQWQSARRQKERRSGPFQHT